MIFLLISNRNISAQTDMSGLYFSSHEVVQDNRTSLNLSPGKPYKLNEGFSLEFDVKFRRGDGYYGYIFRIIGNGTDNIDFVSNLASHTSNFWLVYKDQILLSYKWDDLPSMEYDQWIKVKLDFNTHKETLILSFNDKIHEVAAPRTGLLKSFEIVFGASKLNTFYSTDVCPMSVRNIRLYTPGDKLFRQWLLGKHADGKVYDETVYAEATADNPVWLIDKYIQWQKLTQLHVDGILGITPDEDNERLFFVNDNTVCTLDLETLNTVNIQTQNGSAYRDILGRNIIYNKYTDELWSYDFHNPVSRFNFNTREWSEQQLPPVSSEYSHHNKFISPVDSSLVTLFGYGFYTYKGIVNSYDRHHSTWKQIDHSDQIPPRYYSSIGFTNDDKILVFGGYGSKSGRQELSPRSFYDLYLFNPEDHTFTHIWTLDNQPQPFIPSETMVVDEKERKFYTLIYSNGPYESQMQLAEFSLDKPEFRLVGNTIPFKFRDTETWVYLYLNKRKSDLIAIVNHKDDVSVYSIAFPPLTKKDILQDVPSGNRFITALIAVSTLTALFLLLLILYKKTKSRDALINQTKTVESISLSPLPVLERKQVSAIYLLGGFQIYNKEGRNITALFSPTLKQLFLFILLHSVNQKGVSSAKLDKALWYDKTGDSARNNRNVNISKLRSLLEETGGIAVENKSSMWWIHMNGDIYCDYMEIMNLICKSRAQILTGQQITTLLMLLQGGELLPNIHTEWIETYKTAFTKQVNDALTILLNQTSSYENDTIRFHISDYLLSVDNLNEEALSVKCSLLIKAGKQSLAKIAYDSFVKNYEQQLGIPYPVSFNDISQ